MSYKQTPIDRLIIINNSKCKEREVTKLEKLAIRMAENRQELREAGESVVKMLEEDTPDIDSFVSAFEEGPLSKDIGLMLTHYKETKYDEDGEPESAWPGWERACAGAVGGGANINSPEKLSVFCELKYKQKQLKQEYGRLKTTICAIGRGLKARALKGER